MLKSEFGALEYLSGMLNLKKSI